MPRPLPGARLIAGVDEVGRGPLAGPVVAAAVILLRPLDGLADSKLLDAPTREQLARRLFKEALIGVAGASVDEIERINILHASMLAMQRAVLRLGCLPDIALVDGNRAPDLPCPADTVVSGDRDVPVIGAASIVAKVLRDRLMQRLSLRYPGYGWETNVGYPTAEHRDAVRRLGVTRHHRRSFATVRTTLLEWADARAGDPS